MSICLEIAFCGSRTEIDTQITGADVISLEDFGNLLLGGIEKGLGWVESHQFEGGRCAALVDNKGGRRDGDGELCTAALRTFLERAQGFFGVLGEML